MAESTSSKLVDRISREFDQMRAAGKSSDEIFVTLYRDLKQLAQRKVQAKSAGQSMHATRLLSDLWMRLFGKGTADFTWDDGRHFFNAMAEAMQHLLIDHSRRRASHGGDHKASLEELSAGGFQAVDPAESSKWKNLVQENVERALFIQEVLNRLEHESDSDESKKRIAKRQAEIVRLRLFLGLAEDETAEILGCSSETVTKEFRKAKAKIAAYIRSSTANVPSRPN
jgi:RNA polymerase sigma factor (TIGR02999 family)